MSRANFNSHDRGMLASCAQALLMLAVCFAAMSIAHAQEIRPATKEEQIKAAFIYNFIKFIEWPAASFASSSDSFVIGVLAQTPLAAELEAAVQDRHVNGRAFVVRRVSSSDELKGVHVLFVAAEQDAGYRVLAPRIQHDGILTVGESESFAEAGGIINFVIAGDKVRFAINLQAAELAHLKISAQLLKLAVSVRTPS